MENINPSDAERNLQEARAMTAGAPATLVQGRLRWALVGGGVFAASVLFWLAGPESSNIISLVLVVVAVMAALTARFPAVAGLTGQRARLTGTARRRQRTLLLATMLGVVALFFPINAAVMYFLDEPYPISGAVVGLVLALAGPPFAKWWTATPGSRG